MTRYPPAPDPDEFDDDDDEFENMLDWLEQAEQCELPGS